MGGFVVVGLVLVKKNILEGILFDVVGFLIEGEGGGLEDTARPHLLVTITIFLLPMA